MFSRNRGGDDASEIHGKVVKVTNSPAGGKRVEVDAHFEQKTHIDDPSLPDYMRPPSAFGSERSQRIKIDMNNEEAKRLKTDDEIRARIQEKYSKSGQSGRCGLGAAGDIYNHVETLKDGPGGKKNSRKDRFKGCH